MFIIKAHKFRFLLARLQIELLVHQTSARNIYKALDHLPEKLNETFHDGLERIRSQPPGYSTLAEQVISWMFYAKRPLRMPELREALAAEPGDTELDRLGLQRAQALAPLAEHMLRPCDSREGRRSNYACPLLLSTSSSCLYLGQLGPTCRQWFRERPSRSCTTFPRM